MKFSNDVAFTCFIASFMLLVTSVVDSQDPVNGPKSYGRECCSHRITDSTTALVAIETSRPLVPATYRAVRLRACTADTTFIQVWRRLDATTYQFRWQQQWTPSPYQTTLTYVIIPITTPLTITAQDRLGFYTLSSANQLSVPFDVNQTSSVQYSSVSITNPTSVFNINQPITLDASFSWPRTFQNYVSFCTNADCSDQPLSSELTASATPGNGQCCIINPTLIVSCDPSQDTKDQLNQQTTTIEYLQNIINQLNQRITDIVSQNTVTGLCDPGFIPGSYGTGKCYLPFVVSMNHNEAQLLCRENNAYLLTINSLLEENFIVNFIQNNSGYASPTNVWTSGMNADGKWWWYQDPATTLTNEMFYTKWRNNVVPVPTNTYDDICMSVAIDRARNEDYWLKQNCNTRLFVICEQHKVCL